MSVRLSQILEMDLMSRTDLFDRLDTTGPFTEPEASGMARNLLLAVRMLETTYGSCGTMLI